MTNKERALMVAEKAHAGQSYDIYPYMFHIHQVKNIAEEFGFKESVVIACILHDTLEDTSLSYNDIKKAFGYQVAEIVYSVTDELGRDNSERKEKTYPKIRKHWENVAVKLCDRIANIKHSAEYNLNMYTRYINQHENFSKELYKEDHVELKGAWTVYNSLVDNGI